MDLISEVAATLSKEYEKVPKKLKIIDVFLLFQLLTALVQVCYVGLVGTFPFNSFLAGFISCVGSFVLTVCLRIQCNFENKDFKDIHPERAFAEYTVGILLLHLVVITFVG
ncbi:Dolichyl-diphosphooligosaccharide-protein glycosyltransferase subunit dad1 [Cymbomonas tetramitiformis]|uniref:Dolichyl-diphosphooligosaccharide--protein glycosyltransferase subunit DAD1 n=1 Tax=Cymbomonas tetramitiformis TaxID=36881 RepID=A0AAE0GJK6_9CHLO|nr:Dolichyl-diphosphooligosaccharide-protein glycosyltransferase subunit dad1 [Cymbomonas tetramitiformis]